VVEKTTTSRGRAIHKQISKLADPGRRIGTGGNDMTAIINLKNYAYSTINLAYGCEQKDNNTVIYKRDEQGNKVLKRVILGPGWENIPFKPQCEIGKGEEDMANGKLATYTHKTGYHKDWLDWGTLMPQVRELIAEGRTVPEAARILEIKPNTLQRHMQEEKKRQTPEPVPPAKHEPAQEAESAPDIITDTEPQDQIVTVHKWKMPTIDDYPGHIDLKEAFGPIETEEVKMTLGEYQKQKEKKEAERTYTAPLKGSYDECDGEKISPANRFIQALHEDMKAVKPITITGYNNMLAGATDTAKGTYPEAERQATWDQYCERTAVELLTQGWAVDVFKHHALSRERKLELIGWLLDLGVGA
jgi:hypothetical protein